MSTVSANPSTQQTNTNVIPARTGSTVDLEKVYVSSDTALTFTLVNSVTHDVIFRMYVGARGGMTEENIPRTLTRQGEGVDYTTSDAGNIYFKLEYSRRG